MLTSLYLKNFIVFPELSLEFEKGVTVITGETGAGKTTLLKALQLLFGQRAQKDVVRYGEETAILMAHLTIKNNPNFIELCKKFDIPIFDDVIIRRHISRSKAGKCYINDLMVTSATLAAIAVPLAEICAQFDGKEYFSPINCRKIIDHFITDTHLRPSVIEAFSTLKQAEKKLEAQRNSLKSNLAEQDYLRHIVAELEKVSPVAGEEETLVSTRQSMMSIEKNMSDFQSCMNELSHNHIEDLLLKVIRKLSALEKYFPEELPPITANINEALEHIAQGTQALSHFVSGLEYNPELLSEAEERLFLLRDMARKHNVTVEALCDLYLEFSQKLTNIDHGEDILKVLEQNFQKTEIEYTKLAQMLSQIRKQALPSITKIIQEHLDGLNLLNMVFHIAIHPASRQSDGIDDVCFEVSSSNIEDYASIYKKASGGELSRFILAIKAALCMFDAGNILIFDEIDRGVGGATAAAVGEKLVKISQSSDQVIVITHSPQVAAKGDHHYHVVKKSSKMGVTSFVQHLSGESRREELARMLSGTNITEAARMAADDL